MQVPSILQGKSLKRLLQGAAAGAVATMIIGFNWGGWTLRSAQPGQGCRTGKYRPGFGTHLR